MSVFDKLAEEIKEGIEGKNNFIPIGMERLGNYANIRKRIMTLLFSTSGAGKSSMADTIILNACNAHMEGKCSLKPDFQLFSMERSAQLRIAKWVSFFVFRNEGVEIPIPKMLGWWDNKLNKTEHSLILKQKEYIDTLLNEYITIHEGAKTPKEIYKITKDHFESVGEYDTVTIKGKSTKIYVPNNPNIITSLVYDHGNLTKTTQELPSKKQAIDKLVAFAQDQRDLEGANILWISQVNRAISGVTRQKDTEQELTTEDVKESGDIVDACDLAISLFDPLKYKQSSKTGYDPVDFVDKTNGNNYFRSAMICKSSYGADGVRIPLAFHGAVGNFLELPKRNELDDHQYQKLVNDVISKQYFLK